MTDIGQKAQAMVNGVLKERGIRGFCIVNRQTGAVEEALCRAIEQHEAFRQEVSDVAEEVVQRQGKLQALLPFIIPAPKPYPLMAAMKKAGWNDAYISNAEPSLRAALDALGFEIREKNDV